MDDRRDGAESIWVLCGEHDPEALEARLTKYLIADDVEAKLLDKDFFIGHFQETIYSGSDSLDGIWRASRRFGENGWDYIGCKTPDTEFLNATEVESLRVKRGVPKWGRELSEGMLAPEARLDESDISYQKGCYIGQEVISRIKSAGKVNRTLTKFAVEGGAIIGEILDADGKKSGQLTSIAGRAGLGYLKRGVAADAGLRAGNGSVVSVVPDNLST